MHISRTLIVAAMALAGLSVHATPFTFVGLDAGKSDGVTITYDGKSYNVSAGVAILKLNGSDPFTGLCVDLDHWNSNNQTYNVNVRPATDLNNGARAAWLVKNALPSVTSKSMGAGLQLAVWDIIYDNGDGLNNGRVKSNVSGSIKTAANNFLAQSSSKSSTEAYWFEATSHGSKNNKNQNFMSPVPEPASMIALGFGAMALLRRRRK
ncbi:MAG: PEP-CTERM sorting domain-containing protein [Fimbriimonadaceae bacterium]|nr:PEP-CTERM sorting domain-containing protein [Fimbriimonadaceae bacterium]